MSNSFHYLEESVGKTLSFIGKLNLGLLSDDNEMEQLTRLLESGVKITIEQINKNGKIVTISLDILTNSSPDFCFNALTRLNISESTFINVKTINRHFSLKKLMIWKCGLDVIPPGLNLPALEELDLSDNNIKKIEHLEGFPSIKKIDLNYNNISKLDGLVNLPNLERLFLTGNHIHALELDGAAQRLPRLSYISLTYNHLESITYFRNFPAFLSLNIGNNALEHVGNLSNLPRLRSINISNNPVKSFSDLDGLPDSVRIESITISEYTEQELHSIYDYMRSVDIRHEIWDENDNEDNWDHRLPPNLLCTFFKTPPHPLKKRISEYVSVEFDEKEDRIMIYVNGERFLQCTSVFIPNLQEKIEQQEFIDSIDEAVEVLIDPSEKSRSFRAGIKISREEEFWAHCSNLQAWVEHEYDTRILHRNLAFPLLKKLTEAGDPVARRVFKEEIIRRFESGYKPVQEYLLAEGYMKVFSDEELAVLGIDSPQYR